MCNLKEGRKELAPRETKLRYRRLDTTIRERAGSSQVPREAQESERYPGAIILCFFFLFIRNLRCDRQIYTRHGQGGSLPWFKVVKGSPPISQGFLGTEGGANKTNPKSGQIGGPSRADRGAVITPPPVVCSYQGPSPWRREATQLVVGTILCSML